MARTRVAPKEAGRPRCEGATEECDGWGSNQTSEEVGVEGECTPQPLLSADGDNLGGIRLGRQSLPFCFWYRAPLLVRNRPAQ